MVRSCTFLVRRYNIRKLTLKLTKVTLIVISVKFKPDLPPIKSNSSSHPVQAVNLNTDYMQIRRLLIGPLSASAGRYVWRWRRWQAAWRNDSSRTSSSPNSDMESVLRSCPDCRLTTCTWRKLLRLQHQHAPVRHAASLQCESKNPPWDFLTFFPKRLGIFSPNFTRLLHVPIYVELQIII